MWDCCGVWDNTPVEVWGDVLLAEISVYRYYLQFIHIYSACFRPLPSLRLAILASPGC